MNQDPSSFAANRVRPLASALDYPRLVASLAAFQASTRTAIVATRLSGRNHATRGPIGALADVIEGGPGWTAAVAALAGRFHGPDAGTTAAAAADARS